MKKPIIFLGIIAVVIIVLIVAVVKKAPSEGPLVLEENAVVMGDQKPGNNVTVHYVKLDKPGYVVIYKTTDNAGSKRSVGTSTLLPAGEHFNVTVTTTTPVVDGDEISAELNADNGDGVFSPATDSFVRDTEAGDPIEADAIIDEDASEEINLAEEATEEGYEIVNEDASEETALEAMEEESHEESSMETDESTTEEETEA